MAFGKPGKSGLEDLNKKAHQWANNPRYTDTKLADAIRAEVPKPDKSKKPKK